MQQATPHKFGSLAISLHFTLPAYLNAIWKTLLPFVNKETVMQKLFCTCGFVLLVNYMKQSRLWTYTMLDSKSHNSQNICHCHKPLHTDVLLQINECPLWNLVKYQ